MLTADGVEKINTRILYVNREEDSFAFSWKFELFYKKISTIK